MPVQRVESGIITKIFRQAAASDPPRKASRTLPARTMAIWGPNEMFCYSLNLAANAALVVRRAELTEDGKQFRFYLTALERTTGKILSETLLSCAATVNGLSIDRNGRILVALRDGSIVCYGN